MLKTGPSPRENSSEMQTCVMLTAENYYTQSSQCSYGGGGRTIFVMPFLRMPHTKKRHAKREAVAQGHLVEKVILFCSKFIVERDYLKFRHAQSQPQFIVMPVVVYFFRALRRPL
jgi:hypothetical protein